MTSALTRPADWSARTPKRLWLISFALFFTLTGAWAAASPLGSSPDEHAHFIRAAAVARGQIGGTEVMVPHTVAGIEGHFAETGVQLPEWYRNLPTMHECYSWRQAQPASCTPSLGNSEKTAQATTAAGRYHPGYYLVTGWPSLLVDGPKGLYLMRFMSALLCSALLASAVVTAAEWRRRALAMLGVFAAATPMTLYMAGMVNPSGGEIAAGILVWTALLSIVLSPDPVLLNRRLARLGVGGLVLINIRPLGLIWFGGAVFFCLLLTQRRGVLGQVLRRKALWLWTGLLGLATAGALLWAAGHPDNSKIDIPDSLTTGVAAKRTLGNTEVYIKQMLGFFGWLDTPAPSLMYLVWMAVLATVVALALVYGRGRDVVAVLGMLVAVVMVPVAAQASQAERIGMVWQGRYLLPFAVGLPLMAVLICATRAPAQGFRWRRLTGFAVAGLALADVAAFYWTLRRFAVGTKGSWVATSAHWAPPGGWALWTCVYAVAAVAVVLPALLPDREDTTARHPDRTPRPERRPRVPEPA
ncbi:MULTISPECIES: DUF2142 domain-containing protein [unclassified Streptomyces]|uniref:DUF2142 domain-containing protein n=1 Tax=unclassified Streptomyces TaxID=2593676 RepID=UPI0004AAD51D|nr:MULTISPECIES: DUF2142 domain-containing protein [unclassified Streptomyces]APU40163.1 hypothetical protein BSL84_10700 [Streptomyces sp. TN58]KJK54384.1 hypothetical protein UK14_01510 [Streptomyces sp. NRRL F-4428]